MSGNSVVSQVGNEFGDVFNGNNSLANSLGGGGMTPPASPPAAPTQNQATMTALQQQLQQEIQMRASSTLLYGGQTNGSAGSGAPASPINRTAVASPSGGTAGTQLLSPSPTLGPGFGRGMLPTAGTSLLGN
jgi:hypothetical protein